jgi:hypothetical protein
MAERPSMVVSCRYCPWQASLRGDSYLEIMTFLQALAMEHGTFAHPERRPHLLTDAVIVATEPIAQ